MGSISCNGGKKSFDDQTWNESQTLNSRCARYDFVYFLFLCFLFVVTMFRRFLFVFAFFLFFTLFLFQCHFEDDDQIPTKLFTINEIDLCSFLLSIWSLSNKIVFNEFGLRTHKMHLISWFEIQTSLIHTHSFTSPSLSLSSSAFHMIRVFSTTKGKIRTKTTKKNYTHARTH